MSRTGVVLRWFALAGAGLAAALLWPAETWAETWDDDEPSQAVARIAYLSGEVSYNRGDDPDNWQAAALNSPMTYGDRVYASSNARLVLQLETGDVYLNHATELGVMDLTLDTTQLSLTEGVASFRIHRLFDGHFFEVDTPNVSITFDTPGYYRVDVDRDGNSRLSVWRGNATAAAGGGEIALRAGEAIWVTGFDAPEYDIVAVPRQDSWDRWVERRAGRSNRTRHSAYASPDIVGLYDLDGYGEWYDVPEYGWAWTPHGVASGWQPYRQGRWIWQDPWGWTWVGEEAWAWAPYHYGRWTRWHSRWYWVPSRPAVTRVRWAPALVVFLGGGPGWSATITIGGGYVGWLPLGPADPFDPWWHRRRHDDWHPPQGHYQHHTYLTVVGHDHFVSGRNVARHYVRDVSIVRQVGTAPVLRGPVPILPTRDSLRPDVGRTGRVTRPPVIASRPVVARVAPPPAPPRFDDKLTVIREGGGRPVTMQDAVRLAGEGGRGGVTVTPIRPATPQEPGRVTLTPRRDTVSRPMTPVTIPTGRIPAGGQPPPRALPPGQPTPRPEVRPSPVPETRPTPGQTWRPTPSVEPRPTQRPREYPTPTFEQRPTPRVQEQPTPSAGARPTPEVSRRPTPSVEPRPTSRPLGPPTPATEKRPTTDREVRPTPPAETRPTATPTPRPTAQPRTRPSDRPRDRDTPPGRA